MPSAVVSPIFAGCVAAVYVGTGAGHFEPARNAMVFVVGSDPEPPLDREDRRAYQQELKHLLAGAYPEKPGQNADKAWEHLQSHAKVEVDTEGRPVLEMHVGENLVQVGVSADNILNGNAPPQLVRQLLEARLESELRHSSSHGITETEVTRDWELLEKTLGEGQSALADPHRSTFRSSAWKPAIASSPETRSIRENEKGRAFKARPSRFTVLAVGAAAYPSRAFLADQVVLVVAVVAASGVAAFPAASAEEFSLRAGPEL